MKVADGRSGFYWPSRKGQAFVVILTSMGNLLAWHFKDELLRTGITLVICHSHRFKHDQEVLQENDTKPTKNVEKSSRLY